MLTLSQIQNYSLAQILNRSMKLSRGGFFVFFLKKQMDILEIPFENISKDKRRF